MTRLSIEQAQLSFPTLVRKLKAADAVEVVENEQVIARLNWRSTQWPPEIC